MQNRLWITSLVVAAACASIAFAWWYRLTSVDSRVKSLTTSTDSKTPYTSDQACVACHSQQGEDYQSSGHASTFHATAEREASRWLDGRTFKDPERPYSYTYALDEETGLSVSIPTQFGEDRFPLPYVFGSGQHALTFLSLVPDRLGDSIGVEHRVSLYRSGDNWELDLTPGHRAHFPAQEVEHFGKVMRGDKLIACVSCHTTPSEGGEQPIEDLRPHVGCQNCHGPGREHAEAMEDAGRDNYRGFTRQTAREEVEMCGRCHRLAHADESASVSPSDIRIVRFQSVGLLQSRCFKESNDRLRCTTCHDPHKTVSRDKGYYFSRCLNCHLGPDSSSCPVSPETNCIECHMPAFDIHRGIEFHDHWIRVRSELSETAATERGDE